MKDKIGKKKRVIKLQEETAKTKNCDNKKRGDFLGKTKITQREYTDKDEATSWQRFVKSIKHRENRSTKPLSG